MCHTYVKMLNIILKLKLIVNWFLTNYLLSHVIY